MITTTMTSTTETTMLNEPVLVRPGVWDSADLSGYAAKIRQVLGDKLRAEMSSPASLEELEAHLAHCPDRYWLRVDEASLRWHVALIRSFFVGLSSDETMSMAPVFAWRHVPDRGYTEVAMCSWDRLGLLAKVAGAFAEADLNVLQANIYTRADDLVLDIFRVCDGHNRYVEDERQLKAMKRILAAHFDVERDWALMARGDAIPEVAASGAHEDDNRIVVEWLGDASGAYAPIEIQAPDRVGLLHTMFQALADLKVNVVQAIITTDNGMAGDVLFLADRKGQPITSPGLRGEIRDRLRQALVSASGRVRVKRSRLTG